jgi:hypothetical protein
MNRPKTIHLPLTLLGMVGTIALVLPFTSGNSPLHAASDKDLWRLALPFFLSILASAASLRWILSGSLSLPERAIAYLASAAAAVMTLSVYLRLGGLPTSAKEWVSWILPLATMFVGLCLLIRNSLTGRSREFIPVMALQVAYIANAVMCLILFAQGWQLGAYCVLLTAVTFALQIILASAQPSLQMSEAPAVH